MLNFFIKSLPNDFFQGACDIHSHILPGVDDGFQSEADSIEALHYVEQLGFAKMCLTPHFMKQYDNNKEKIVPRFEAFRKKVSNKCKIQLRLGAEHMLDSDFPEHFKRGFLTIDSENSFVLCETSYLMCEPNTTVMLYDIMLDGYTPVIAHPERYQYASKQYYERWKDKGYLYQLNLLSLTGAYGETAMVKSHQMLRDGMYDYVGTDLHRLDNFRNFLSRLRLSTKEIDALHLLFENNAKLF
ncbi:MAG: hypothetical protein MJZ97_05355 [Bacteroidales bacterium]|nr:hypothetical protein [Bacteroidales bacterium]